MIETKALGPSIRAGGSLSNFSISGKETSTWGRPELRRASISSGSRCSVCGPVGDLETPLRAQQVRHLARVVLVHLAAEGAYEELLRHVIPARREMVANQGLEPRTCGL